MNEEQTKALKALEAAVRKCHRAGVEAKANYTIKHGDGSTFSNKI